MPARCILDASVAGAAYFTEINSVAARTRMSSCFELLAPHLILLEVANIAAMKFIRGEVDKAFAAGCLPFVESEVTLAATDADLAADASRLALDHGFTSYDASYLVLAGRTGLQVLTADQKLVRTARGCGLGNLVEPLI